MMTREEHLASLPPLDAVARACFRQAWDFATMAERERCAGVVEACIDPDTDPNCKAELLDAVARIREDTR
jgi:hypothetical protein